ncbi:MAG TPA: MBL fold metallo-hydrolase [Nitrososphaeraceae archaeon]|nr:MBL fold metallo-hydrolase [Nitrososphaeraceae archaeon]
MKWSFFDYLPVVININYPIFKKRVFFVSISFSVLSLFFIFNSDNAFSQKYDHVEINNISITDNVFTLTGKGGNVGLLLGSDGVLLIDDQFSSLTDKILYSLKKLTNDSVKFVVNTHWHPDYTDGNINFGKLGSEIVAHEKVREHLTSVQFIKFLDRKIDPYPNEGLPLITYKDSITFHINDEIVNIFHVPNAHTDGDSIIHFIKNNVIHIGDVYVYNRYLFIDISSNGSIDGIIDAVKRVIPLFNDKTEIIPGHGNISNINDIKNYLFMLEDVRRNILSMINSGFSLTEIIDSKPTKKYDLIYGQSLLHLLILLKQYTTV